MRHAAVAAAPASSSSLQQPASTEGEKDPTLTSQSVSHHSGLASLLKWNSTDLIQNAAPTQTSQLNRINISVWNIIRFLDM